MICQVRQCSLVELKLSFVFFFFLMFVFVIFEQILDQDVLVRRKQNRICQTSNHRVLLLKLIVLRLFGCSSDSGIDLLA